MSLEHSPAREGQHGHNFPHLTTKELCARWRMNPETLSTKYRRLGLRPIKLGKKLLYPLDQIERCEHDHMQAE